MDTPSQALRFGKHCHGENQKRSASVAKRPPFHEESPNPNEINLPWERRDFGWLKIFWLRKTQQRRKGRAFSPLKIFPLHIRVLRELREEFDALASPLLKARMSIKAMK
jgi:hypothetical protein